jgi:hypothetical protein
MMSVPNFIKMLQWHDVHTKFYKNASVGSGVGDSHAEINWL